MMNYHLMHFELVMLSSEGVAKWADALLYTRMDCCAVQEV